MGDREATRRRNGVRGNDKGDRAGRCVGADPCDALAPAHHLLVPELIKEPGMVAKAEVSSGFVSTSSTNLELRGGKIPEIVERSNRSEDRKGEGGGKNGKPTHRRQGRWFDGVRTVPYSPFPTSRRPAGYGFKGSPSCRLSPSSPPVTARRASRASRSPGCAANP